MRRAATAKGGCTDGIPTRATIVREDDDDWEEYEDNLYEYDAERLLFKRVIVLYEYDAKNNQYVRVAKSTK